MKAYTGKRTNCERKLRNYSLLFN